MLEAVECCSAYSPGSHYHSKRFRRCAFGLMHLLEGIPGSLKDCTEAMDNGNIAKCVFPFLSWSALRKGGTDEADQYVW